MSESRGSTTWVQPIVVDKTGDHIGTIICAAAASALVRYRTPTRAEWNEWDADNIAKTVRRADPRTYEKARAATDLYAEVTNGSSRALAMLPHHANTLPSAVARLQVTGTDLPVCDDAPTGALFTVLLNADLAMSTGKAAAQAAHAVHIYVTEHISPENAAWWAATPADFTVKTISATDLNTAAASAPVLVHDAGHTEVAAGSLTAVLVPAHG